MPPESDAHGLDALAGAFTPQRFVEAPAMLLGGLRRHHAFADAPRDIPLQWQAFLSAGPLPGQVPGAHYGVMCGGDAQGLEYMTAVQVADLDALAPSTGRMRVPAAYYAVFVHDAPPSTLRLSWERLWREWLPGSGFAPAHTPDFERYASDGTIEVWFPVVRAP